MFLGRHLHILHSDADGLASNASTAVSALRARSHNALYQHIVDKRDAPRAAARLADILLLIPNLMVRSLSVRLLVSIKSGMI